MGFHGVTGTQSNILSKREKRVPGEAQAAGGWSAAGRAKDSQSQPGRPRGWEAAGGLRRSPPALAQRGCSPTLARVHPAVGRSTY